MRKYGFLKHSLVDYPGEICSVVFMPGCNFHCKYCYNRNLAQTVQTNGFLLSEIMQYLRDASKRFITAVCITGGEPSLSPETLNYLIDLFKGLGLKVKVDSNGSHPEQMALWDVDYIAMDLKTSPERYVELTPMKDIESRILESMQILLKKPVTHYEFRTTLSRDFVDNATLEKIGGMLTPETYWYLQPCRDPNRPNDRVRTIQENTWIQDALSVAQKYSKNVFLRA